MNRQINLICHDWKYYRRKLVNTCIHRSGGAIAEIGSTFDHDHLEPVARRLAPTVAG